MTKPILRLKKNHCLAGHVRSSTTTSGKQQWPKYIDGWERNQPQSFVTQTNHESMDLRAGHSHDNEQNYVQMECNLCRHVLGCICHCPWHKRELLASSSHSILHLCVRSKTLCYHLRNHYGPPQPRQCEVGCAACTGTTEGTAGSTSYNWVVNLANLTVMTDSERW